MIVAVCVSSYVLSSTALTVKVADVWPARIVTEEVTVASDVSLLASETVRAEVVGPTRVTVPVATSLPAPSEKVSGVMLTDSV